MVIMGNLCCGPEGVKTPPQIVHQHFKGRASIISTVSNALASSSKKVVICVHDYKDATSGKRFRKGDSLQVYSEIDDEWLKVLNLSTKDIGCIPKNYTLDKSKNEIEDWFVGHITRREAERMLMNQEALASGLFLVRYSENKENSYVISILDYDDKQDFQVVHIKIIANQFGFVINSETYSSLSEIIHTYKRKKKISKPCPKPQPHLWDLDVAHKKEWELARDDIEFVKTLGEGHFAKVHLAFWKSSTKVAVKVLKEQSICKDALLEEASIMKKFRHPGLITLYGVCSETEPVYLVLEYMKNGDLLSFLRSDVGNKLKLLDLIDIAHQISCAMQHLETKNLVHRDLAARNVLVGNNNIVKVSDFGLARLLDNNNNVYKDDDDGSNIAYKWTAPEAILSREFSTKSDIWSYGILLTEIFSYGRIPYPGISAKEVLKRVLSGYRMKKSNDQLPDSIYNMMLQCWKAVPEERTTFRSLSIFFSEFLVYSDE